MLNPNGSAQRGVIDADNNYQAAHKTGNVSAAGQ